MPKVLIIDDEAPLTTLIGRFFGGAGFDVDTATSGQQGLSRAIATQPDVILLDIMMPDVDGYEVCRRLRSDPRTARATIVIVTARAQPIDKQMAMRAGADAHVIKPFNGRALVDSVKQLLADRAPTVALGRQIMVARLKPAVGATTLVANLAVSLAEPKGCQVAAVDITPGGGPLAAMLGVSSPSPSSFAKSPLESAADWVGARLQKQGPGLSVLPGLPLPASGTQPDGTCVGQILAALRGWFDYVVIDTPVALGPLAPVLLGTSALVLLVLTADPAVARAAQVTTLAIQKHAGRPVPVWPVLSGLAASEPQIRAQLEQALGAAPITMPWVPDAWSRASAAHQPLISNQPQSAMAVAVRTLAEQIAGRAGAGA